MNTQCDTTFEENLKIDTSTIDGELSRLVIYNDDVNTFDWVIQCLMEVCQHTEEQAEQLSLIIHFKGKATVKTGCYEDLVPRKDALIERGLSVVIKTEYKKA